MRGEGSGKTKFGAGISLSSDTERGVYLSPESDDPCKVM